MDYVNVNGRWVAVREAAAAAAATAAAAAPPAPPPAPQTAFSYDGNGGSIGLVYVRTPTGWRSSAELQAQAQAHQAHQAQDPPPVAAAAAAAAAAAPPIAPPLPPQPAGAGAPAELEAPEWARGVGGLWERQASPDVYVYVSQAGLHGPRSVLNAGEILQRLHLNLAAQDASRFPSVCQLLEEAFAQVFTPTGVYASGSTQRMLLGALEQTSVSLRTNGRFYRQEYYSLVRGARAAMVACPAASRTVRRRLQEALSAVSMPVSDRWAAPDAPHPRTPLDELPEDVILHMLNFLPDHEDLLRLSETCRTLWAVRNSPNVWHRMCLGSFPVVLLKPEMEVSRGPDQRVDWESVYKACLQRLRGRELFWDTLTLCQGCECVFWLGSGHPHLPHARCPLLRNLSPQEFFHQFRL